MKDNTNSACIQNDKKEIVHICDSYHRTIEFIGKRWMGIIIYTLLDGPKRYHELLSAIPGISDRLLIERLRDLEHEGLIERTTLKTSARAVQYMLTPVGEKLEDVIKAIKSWVQYKESH